MVKDNTTQAVVKLNDVNLCLNNKNILEHISFDIPAKQITTLIGPNGAGKTTLLKIILGIVAPSSGTVWKKEGIKIGYVPQKLYLSKNIPLTVERFLCLNEHYNRKELMDILEETRIPDLLSSSIHLLSGGEMQRVMFARSLLKHPDLLVLDEPAQGLDPVAEEQFYALLNRFNQEKKCAVIMVSHDLHIVLSSSHQVLCINRHICCRGSAKEIISHPDCQQLFGEESLLSLYRHRHDHRHLPNGDIKYVD